MSRPGVGHYGVFSGTRWATQIYPMVRNTILASESDLAEDPVSIAARRRCLPWPVAAAPRRFPAGIIVRQADSRHNRGSRA